MRTISTHVKALVGVLLLVLTTAFADAQSITINSVASTTACQGTTVSLTFTTKNGNGTNEKFFDQQDAAGTGYPPTSFYSVFSDGTNTYTSDPFNLSGVDFPTPSNATKTITYQVPIPLTVPAGTYTMTLIAQYPSVTASIGGVLINVVTNTMGASMTSVNMGVCQNAAQPTITFTGWGELGGVYTFYYTLNGSPAQVSSASGGNTATVSVPTATAGTFTYTLTGVSNSINACGITAASGTSVISVSSQPSGFITSSNGLALNCTVPSTILTAPAGTAYMWSTSAATQSITVSTGGTWSVTVWNGGCSADFAATTSSDKNPPSGSINASNGVDLNCTTPSTTLTAPTGASYMWSNGSTASSITVSAAGTWSVTVTGANGCKADFSASTTSDKNPPSGSIGASNGLALNCIVPSTVLTAPTGASYVWSDNSTSSTLTVSTAGTWSVTVTGTNGCTADFSATTTSDKTPPSGSIGASSGLALNCTNPSTILTAPTGASYVWSDNSTSSTLTVSTAGTWSVTVTGANGCTADFSATTTSDKNPPTGSITNDNGLALSCTIPSTTLTAPSGASYAWSNGATTQDITVTTGGTWSVTVTGANGCTADFSTATTIDASIPSGSVTNDNGLVLNCNISSTTLTAPAGASYLWSTGATTQSITVSTGATYSVTVTSSGGCSADFSAVVTEDKNPPSGSITNNNGLALNCSVTSTTLTAPAGASYLWSDNSTASTLTVSTAGTWSVTVTSANGCMADFSVSTTLNNTPPTAGITNNTGSTEINCTYPSISVTATGGVSYAWTGGLGTGANASITAAGTYTVTVTGSNGCTSETAITVTQNTTVPTAAITNNTGTTVLTCNTPAISVTATGGASYVWSNGLGNNANASITAAGTYSVTVSNANGCSADASISVTSAPLATASISAPAAVCASTPAATLTFAVTGSGTITVTYSDGSSNNTVAGTGSSLSVNVAPSATTTYSIVSVTDANGCVNTASSSATIQVNACAATFTIDAVQPTCFGATNGKIVITNISGGTAPFQISKDNGFSWTPVSNPALFEFLNLGAGVYNIYLKHNDGQIQPMSTTTLTNPARINANVGVTGSITCSNSTVTLNVANIYGGGGAPYMVSVDNGAFSSNSSFTVSAGTHTVSAQDKNGCAMVVGTVVVAGVDPIAMNAPVVANVTTMGGSNGSVTISAKGGSGSYMYTLTRPGGNNTVLNAGTASVTFTGLTAGNYTIAALDNNGCGTAQRTFAVSEPLAAAVPADLVLGSESETNVFPAMKTVSMVYNVANTSNDNAAQGVVLRITKPTPGYKVELMTAASYTNPLGTTYTLDNARWTKTADNDMFIEFTLNADPAGLNYMPAKTFIPKRIGILVTRPATALGKGDFTLTGVVRSSLPDNFGQDNSTVHQFYAQ